MTTAILTLWRRLTLMPLHPPARHNYGGQAQPALILAGKPETNVVDLRKHPCMICTNGPDDCPQCPEMIRACPPYPWRASMGRATNHV